jgi:hypothetical protein
LEIAKAIGLAVDEFQPVAQFLGDATAAGEEVLVDAQQRRRACRVPGRKLPLESTPEIALNGAFLHLSGFEEQPSGAEYGDLLRLDVLQTPKGLRAVRIELVECEVPAAAAYAG